MLIDWFTVVAQAANFLVLVWLLKRFLYKPILGAMDARENESRHSFARQKRTKPRLRKRVRSYARPVKNSNEASRRV